MPLQPKIAVAVTVLVYLRFSVQDEHVPGASRTVARLGEDDVQQPMPSSASSHCFSLTRLSCVVI